MLRKLSLLVLSASLMIIFNSLGFFSGYSHAEPLKPIPAGNYVKGTSGINIVSLGDSYASAPGINPIVDNDCNQSGSNYAHIIARKLNANLTDLSCSGAVTANILTTSQKSDRSPQIDYLTSAANVVLVTIGGNDSGIFDTVENCAFPWLAQKCDQDIAAGNTNQPTVKQKVQQVFAAVRKKAPNALIVGVGYGQPFDGITCPNVPLPQNAATWAKGIGTQDSEYIADGSKSVGGIYFNPASLTSGHGICSADPWYNGILNLSAGQGIIGHPRPIVMNLIAQNLEPMITKNLKTN